ncbi:MAG: undecaprenyl diphosphate synthase family protein, partial [Candidatus Atribacteria bacterium]|nr:undecaprenyl diphosphate synthase family protein [Candidatus Atribacteria bacterium]
MDGNGRWAIERGLPRTSGHKEGAKAVRRIIDDCISLKIPTLTLYAFSTENWN